MSGQPGRYAKLKVASETSPFSIWRSTASFVAAMSWRSKSTMSPGGYTAVRATIRQKKVGRPVRFELSEQTRQAVDDCLKAANKKPGGFLFAGRLGSHTSITTRQYADARMVVIRCTARTPPGRDRATLRIFVWVIRTRTIFHREIFPLHVFRRIGVIAVTDFVVRR
jgi:hypothetical protein